MRAAASQALLSGAARRNAAVQLRLAEALRPRSLAKGAPPTPQPGKNAGGSSAAASTQAGKKLVSAADVIRTFAFTDPNPQSPASKAVRLASITFGGGLAARTCSSAGKDNSADQKVSMEFSGAIGDSGVQAFGRRWADVAASTLTGGFSWLLVQPDAPGTLHVANMPAHVSPLALGLYPVACVDMTAEAVMALPTPPSTAGGETATAKGNHAAPAWSRAYRNATVRFEAPQAKEFSVVPHLEPLSLQRRRHAQSSVAAVDWEFVESQFARAAEWASSESRRQRQAARRSELEEAAKSRLPSRTVHVEELIDDASLAAAGAEPAVPTTANQGASNATTDASGQGMAAATPVEQPARDDALNDPPKRADEEPAKAVGEGQELADGSIFYTLSDGSHEYVRTDATRAIVRPDGTQEEFLASGLMKLKVTPDKTQVWYNHETGSDLARTLVYADGTTTYEYRNGGAITKHADGRTTTRYSNGTVEETAPAAAL
jgi:hypothetical protein